jgi:hypothetical protein
MKMKGGVTAAAACCEVCAKLPHCEGFTFFSGACFLKNCGRSSSAGARAIKVTGAVSGYLK